jgi:D-alanyl-D-alanine carboxypeptidase
MKKLITLFLLLTLCLALVACGGPEDPACTEHTDADKNGKCDVCDADVPLAPHEHNFGETWLSDEENHWQACECGEIFGSAVHADEDVNGACDVCSYAMEIPHQHNFGTAWKSDADNHWQACECGEISGTAAHKDADRNGKCDVCAHAVVVPDPPASPTLNSQHAFIFDCDKNSYLYRCEETHSAPIYPASITKLFTCYVALQYLKDLDEEILLGDEQTLYPDDASRAYFDRGETISVYALLHGVLLPSGSDATYALAAAAGKKILNNPDASGKEAVDAFMVEMNNWAQKLGMGDTHFVTPDGYHHDQHYVSFHAFVTIARCAMNNPNIFAICGKAQETITYKNVSGVTIKHILNNSNKLLSSSNSCYIAEAVGLKTGTTDEAGCCFLGVFMYKGKCVIIGLFGCSNDSNRWKDATALWEYYLALEEFLS